jgi:hypothetical protein
MWLRHIEYLASDTWWQRMQINKTVDHDKLLVMELHQKKPISEVYISIHLSYFFTITIRCKSSLSSKVGRCWACDCVHNGSRIQLATWQAQATSIQANGARRPQKTNNSSIKNVALFSEFRSFAQRRLQSWQATEHLFCWCSVRVTCSTGFVSKSRANKFQLRHGSRPNKHCEAHKRIKVNDFKTNLWICVLPALCSFF